MRLLPCLFLLFSCAEPELAINDGAKLAVGAKNQITLSYRKPNNPDSESQLILSDENLIGSPGMYGRVYNVRGHAIKVLRASDLDGDEIRVLQKVGELGLGPKLFGTWITSKGKDLFVLIDMELIKGTALSVHTSGFSGAWHDDLEAIARLRKNQSAAKTYFFDWVISILLDLVRNKIAYRDAHFGNIINPPSPDRDFKLIDFGESHIYATEKEAACTVLKTTRVQNARTIAEFEETTPAHYQGQKGKDALLSIKALCGDG